MDDDSLEGEIGMKEEDNDEELEVGSDKFDPQI